MRNTDDLPHEHSHPCQPPDWSLPGLGKGPGPCSCGMTYAQTAAEAQLARAQAAVDAAKVTADA